MTTRKVSPSLSKQALLARPAAGVCFFVSCAPAFADQKLRAAEP
jgi:hypothetical protein